MTTMEILRRKYEGSISSEMFDEFETEASADIGKYYYKYFNEVAVEESTNFMSSVFDMIADITSSSAPHFYSIADNINYVKNNEEEIIKRANIVFNKVAEELGDQQNEAKLEYKDLISLIPSILRVDSVSDNILTKTNLVYEFVIAVLEFAENMYMKHHDVFMGFVVNMFSQHQ